MKVDDKQRYLMITEAAYFLAERRNFQTGHEHEDWLAAERQVDEMLNIMAQQPELEQRIESGEKANPARKAATAKAKSQPQAKTATGKTKRPSGGHKATSAQQSVAADTIPPEAMPQPVSVTGEQTELKAEASAKPTRRSTKTEQPAPMTASSQEASKPGRKPRQKKAEANTATKGDGRRRSKTTTV